VHLLVAPGMMTYSHPSTVSPRGRAGYALQARITAAESPPAAPVGSGSNATAQLAWLTEDMLNPSTRIVGIAARLK
jgi:hypothetical protein